MTNNHINIHLDHQPLLVPQGTTGLDLLNLTKTPLPIYGLKVNGNTQPLSYTLQQLDNIKLLTWQDPEGKKNFWESTAHLLALALYHIYPHAHLALGVATEQGFYYDVDFGEIPLDATHLPKIEKKMLEIASKKQIYEQLNTSLQQNLTQYANNPYKKELLQNKTATPLATYRLGNYIDLAHLGRLAHTGYIKAIKLLNLSGAYWRGQTHNPQLTRIHGISFPEKKQLKAYLKHLEEAQKRDHRKLGVTLNYFTFSPQVGLGLPLWLPKGAFLRQQLIDVLTQKLQREGYAFVYTPHIAHKNLYITSGHYDKYSQDTFQPITTPHSQETFLLKSMNCPHHAQIYQSQPRSYKNLPVKLAEFGTVYRYEQHGELHGLIRTRSFTQDDGHIFCMPEQITQELIHSVQLISETLTTFGFNKYTAQISIRHKNQHTNYIGTDHEWTLAEEALINATKLCGLNTTTLEGEAAFYGPKIDFMIEDTLGRNWQLGTIQLDYQLPQRFNLTYTTHKNTLAKPIIIHRAALGSLERFIGILLEHTSAKLPAWLCLQQVAILPISTKQLPYAQQIASQLTAKKIRVYVDQRNEKIARKIRDSEIDKTPYMILVGAQEETKQQAVLRKQGTSSQQTLTLDKLTKLLINLCIAPI